MAGGNNDQMLNMGLMIAAGVAAPELAPFLMEGGAGAAALGIEGGLGATAATGITGAALGGTAGALTGQDVAKSAAMGGLGGAAAGYFGGVNAADPGSMLAAGETVPGAGLNTAPAAQTAGIGSTPMDAFRAGSTDVSQFGRQVPMTPADYAEMPANLPSNTALGRMPGAQDIAYGQNAMAGPSGPSSVMNPAVNSPSAFGKANMIGGGVAGINALLSAPPNAAYTPPGAVYKGGNLQKFKYDPDLYQPDIVMPPNPKYRAQYAEGGITSLAMGGQPNQMYPMSQQEHTNFMDPTQLPSSAMEVRNFEPATNPMTGTPTQPMREGGIAQLAVGGKLLRGDGDGMSDDIKANISGRQEARLADGEFVIPADVVSHLGNGSTDAGAKHLYSVMNKVRQARVGTKKQGRQINPNRYLQA
jgi:hypothetical protein